jgi:ribosomal protein L11
MNGAGFAMSNLALPLTLHSGTAASATITFAPTATGNFNGGITFGTTSSQVQENVPISITGQGIAPAVLAPNPSSLAFGNVQVGSTSSQPETLVNTGGSNVTISQGAASGPGFSISGLALPVTLSAGQSTSFTVLFSPTVSGAASGSVNITSNAPNPNLSIPLSGTGQAAGTLAANPTTLAFGSVQVNGSANLSETLTNTSTSTITISQANLTGTGFSISGLSLPLTLTANQSVTFSATFAPTTSGAVSGMLSVVSNASNSPLNISLSGTGASAGRLTVSPSNLSFGNVAVGSSAPLSGSLSASGTSVTITSASLNNPEFVVSGISLPVTLAVGQSASFTVTFTPQASGAASASLSFSSNAVNSPTTQTMTGTGTAQTQHTVDLSWTASNDVVGYNIYRGTVSGGPYSMINPTLDGTTTYVDNTVSSGQTYYYVATAVNSNSQESGYSNEAQAVIPNP